MERSEDAQPLLTQTAEIAHTAPAERSAHPAPHVLTITPFFPTQENESGGCFIAEPLAEMIRSGLRSTVFAVDPIYRLSQRTTSSAPEASWYRYVSVPSGAGLATAGLGLFWRLRADVKALHKRTRVDLIHAHGALPCGHAAALLSRYLGVPYLVSVHGLDAFSSMQVGGWAGEWCRRASRRVFQDARRVIGISRRVCEEVEKGIGVSPRGKAWVRKPPTVVYNGVDATLFRPGAEASTPTLLTVGNLIPSKGHELVVRSLAALRPEFPGLTWEVIGDGAEVGRVRQLAQELGVLGSTRFLGRRNRRAVADACRRCSVFVLPSGYEGLGCVYLEAMACGKPAMGCTEQGIEEVIRHGENGWLIPPSSLPELIEGLQILLRDSSRRSQIGAAARQTILDGFTLQHQAQRLMAIYQECSG